jgi:predicted RecB family endonuclease
MPPNKPLTISIKLDEEAKKTIEELGKNLNMMSENYKKAAGLLENNRKIMESIVSKLESILIRSLKSEKENIESLKLSKIMIDKKAI